jgi:hypothetical protein
MRHPAVRLLIRTWLTIAVIDFVFASCLSVFAYGNTFMRFWQGIASVLLGPSAMQGGARTMLTGITMHFGVALAWSTVFLSAALAWPRLRRMISTTAGVLGVAAVYGPIVWLVMSLVVIPALTGRPANISGRWWFQIFAHMPFVALPIVWTVSRGIERVMATAPTRATATA